MTLPETLWARINSCLLGLVFIGCVWPVGQIRRWRKRDPLQLKSFKKDPASVMTMRRHEYTREDLLNMF
jgi:hypothetical protein